jgi:radical SAM protein with 4Fe4S-binding SPASM domain
MKCPFCYSASVRGEPVETPLRDAIRFVDRNAEWIDSINFGTGECLLSDNWYEFARYVRETHPAIRQAVTSNGSLALQTEKGRFTMREFEALIDEVDVSLDFADERRHTRMRGNAQAYRWVLETLRLCAQTGIQTTIVLVAFEDTLNTENMRGIFELAAGYGAFVRINVLRPVRGVALEPPSYEKLMFCLNEIVRDHRVVSLCDPLFGSVFRCKGARSDTSGSSSLRILPDGSVTPSTYLITEDWRGARIADEFCLADLKSNVVFRQLNDIPLPQHCRGCSLSDTCRGGAIDRRILHFDTLDEPDPFCPLRHADSLPALHAVQYYNEENRPSVHDGYLPTLIFAP